MQSVGQNLYHLPDSHASGTQFTGCYFYTHFATSQKEEDDMSRRKPNGYGSVTKLKGNRSKPWIIKVTQYDADGNGRQVPLDYAATEEEANIILAKYNHNPWNIDRKNITLADLYNQWAKIKKPKLGTSLQYSLQAAYNTAPSSTV